jgi:hypothetical protein
MSLSLRFQRGFVAVMNQVLDGAQMPSGRE